MPIKQAHEDWLLSPPSLAGWACVTDGDIITDWFVPKAFFQGEDASPGKGESF